MFTPLAVVRDVRTKGTGASRMEPYWTDSSLARARLSPQGAKRHVLHRFGHRGPARRCASSQQFHFVPWDMQVAECTRGMVDEESIGWLTTKSPSIRTSRLYEAVRSLIAVASDATEFRQRSFPQCNSIMLADTVGRYSSRRRLARHVQEAVRV